MNQETIRELMVRNNIACGMCAGHGQWPGHYCLKCGGSGIVQRALSPVEKDLVSLILEFRRLRAAANLRWNLPTPEELLAPRKDA